LAFEGEYAITCRFRFGGFVSGSAECKAGRRAMTATAEMHGEKPAPRVTRGLYAGWGLL